MTRPDEAARLLRALWANLDDAPGYLELRPLYPTPPTRHSREQKRQRDARRWLQLDDAVATLPPFLTWTAQHGLSAYFGVLPRTSYGAGTARDAGAGAVVWADLDIPPSEAKTRIDAVPFAPSAVVLTGRGVHAYWLLSEPTSPEVCAALSRGFAEVLDSDRAVTQAAALLRLPGSVNPKHGRGCVARLVHLDVGDGYHAADLEDWLPAPSTGKRSATVGAPLVVSPAQLALSLRPPAPDQRALCATSGRRWRDALAQLRSTPAGGPQGDDGKPTGEGRKVRTFRLGNRIGYALRDARRMALEAAVGAGLSESEAAAHLDRGIRYGTGELGGPHGR